MKREPVKTNRTSCLILLLVPMLLMPALCWGRRGKIVHLDDGDLGIALYQGKEVKFRLYGVDAPEWKQDFGSKAKSFPSILMLREAVEMEILDRDRYDREVALVFVEGKCVNEEPVRIGLAWVYIQHCRNDRCDGGLRLQQLAKENRLGIWA